MTIHISTTSLFNLYREEKAASLDVLADNFPHFKEWKLDYIAELESDKLNIVVDFSEIADVEYTGPKSATGNANSTQPKVKSKLTNMDKARTIYNDMYELENELPKRKVAIERLVTELGISKACASTYEHKIKQKYS
ncbi:MAG: hypothetical protein KAH32_01060 [Chlamydiia bacterium]|nr:hypothetical protein [Chlamydiia bacterium]